MNNISLIADGKEYKDCWKSVSYSNSMDNFCGGISLSTIDFFEGNPELWNIKKGSSYILKVNEETLSTGYIDEVQIDYTKDGSDIVFTGRDKTEDLVDCCYDGTSYAFKNITILSIIKKLCDAFSIEVFVDPIVTKLASTKLEKFTIDSGRSCSEIIADLCGDNGILPLTLGDGKLTLTQATLSEISTDILSDTNIISCSFSDNNSDRFSVYNVKTEGQGSGSDTTEYFDDKLWVFNATGGGGGKSGSQFKDDNVKRYRPYVIITDVAATGGKCKERAKYEANIRAAKGVSVSYTIEGVTEVNTNKLWRINKLVMVKDDKLKIEEAMLINTTSFTIDAEAGESTVLGLVKKDCFSLSETAVKLAKSGFSL